MTSAKQPAEGREDRALLSLARWRGARAADEARPAISPLLAGLSRAAGRTDGPLRPAPQPQPLGPTLLDLLKANGGKAPAPARPAMRQPARPAAPAMPPLAAPVMGGKRAARPRSPLLRWLAPPLGAIAGALAGYAMAGNPLYSAQAELIVRPQSVRGADGMQPAPAERPALPEAAVARSMARLTTPQVLEPVVDALSLTARAEFGPGDRARAVAKLAQHISVSPLELTAGYTVTATASDAGLSGDIANAVADALVRTHDPLEAGPPPTQLEVALQALPGTAVAGQARTVPAAIGAAAGLALGLLLALAGGRRRRPQAAPTAARSMPAPKPKPTPQPQPPRGGRMPAAQPVAPEAPARAYTALRRPQPPAHAPEPAATTLRQSPEPAMYSQHPHPPIGVYPQAPAPAPAQANGWWPQPHHAPPAYPMPMAPQPMGYGQPPAAYPQPWPPAPAPLYPPAMPMMPQPAAAMPPYAPPPYYPAPPQQPQVHHYAVPVPVPVPYPVPTAMAPTIQHEAPAQGAPANARRPADDTAEMLAAIDQVRAQLRAFAGTLDVLKAARSG